MLYFTEVTSFNSQDSPPSEIGLQDLLTEEEMGSERPRKMLPSHSQQVAEQGFRCCFLTSKPLPITSL